MQEYTVKFKPQNKVISVARGTDLLTAAIKSGIVLNASCGGEGLCGKCKVIINRKEVLACETIIEGDLDVIVPKESAQEHLILSHEAEEFTKGAGFERENAYPFSPLVRKIYLELSRPTPDDNSSDLERITDELAKKVEGLSLSIKLGNVKHLGEVLRDSDFKVTVTVGYKDDSVEILAIEPGNTSLSNYGLAFDIGTTTIAGQLVDLNKKNILGTRIAFNKQASYGADIITRIIYASEPKGLKVLNESVLENINEIVEDLCVSQNVQVGEVNGVSFAGNMTMMHLLLKIDPTNIRKAPYIPTAAFFPATSLSEVGVEANPKGLASILPGVTTYIGGDIVAGVLACGLADNDELSLLIDIGTNGEIVLGNSEWMMGTAASAGPAFEGSGLICGMKATAGAIQKVRIGKSLKITLDTIGGGKPKGICGSGYIDLLCEMLKSGIIGKNGKFDRDKKTDSLRKTAAGYEFVIASGAESDTGKDITIDEDDIENLKRSKGAIYSAIIALTNKVGKNISEVRKMYIAGGFGNYLNIENAIYIGLLPDTDRNVYQFVGNSSLAGARMSLFSHEAFKRAFEIHKKITYLDLSTEPNYMDEYVAALFFPHTDIRRFPSVQL
ncbi:MAG: ASKHA domain-containing protein [Candidatus Omnitrophica bacterium]|nr:ASKHA domain-containing protein [Candidatus Omnitrophota bacterium]